MTQTDDAIMNGATVGHPIDIFHNSSLEQCSLEVLLCLFEGVILGMTGLRDRVAVLCIPLGTESDLKLKAPSLDDIRTRIRINIEPATIGLINIKMQATPFLGEEYKRTVNLLWARSRQSGNGVKVHEYYRCFRDQAHIANNWEFTECVYMEALHD
jgi:hypothetical protein